MEALCIPSALRSTASSQDFFRPVGAVPAQNGHLDIADLLIADKEFFHLLEHHTIETCKVRDVRVEQRGLSHRDEVVVALLLACFLLCSTKEHRDEIKALREYGQNAIGQESMA